MVNTRAEQVSRSKQIIIIAHYFQYIESSDKSSPSYIGSATLEKLIEKLANEKEPDLKYIQTFIHTFRHICEPSAILDRLTTRMRSTTSSTRRNLLSSSLNNNNSKDDQDYLTDWGMIIRLRIVALVQLWVDQFYSLDFASNPQSKKSLDDFIDHIFPRHVEEEMASNVFVLAEFHLIQKLFKDFLGFKEANMGVNASTLSTTSTANSTTGPVSITMTPPSALAIPNEDVVPHSPTKSNPTNKHTVLDFEAENLAQQLTLAEFERYIQVRPIDFLISIWGKREDATVSRALVNYDALVAGFNKVSYWVATEICTQPEMKNRVKVVEKMIKIAKCCMKLKNFNTSMAIYSGLNVSAVSRLKQTWENVESKRIKQMQQIELALAPQMNYRSYRALLDEAETSAASAASFSEADHPQACIPIFGIFIKDLTFMNDGNPKYTDKDLNLINFGKLRLMYSTVVRATRFQKLRYFFNDNSGGGAGGLSTGVLGLSSSNLTIATNNCNIGAAADYVRTLRNLSEQQLYKYSLLCEARGGQEDGRLLNKWIKE